MKNEPPRELTPEEQRKADKALKILYIAMAVLAALPFLLLWLTNRHK